MTASADSPVKGSPNWGSFYGLLGILGPKFLQNVPPGLEEFIAVESRATDSFWSDALEGTLVALWNESPEAAVWEAVQQWGFNVREYLDEIFGPWSLIPWDHLNIDEDEQQT